MYDNYNYPPGADTPDAPWNQSEPEPVNVEVEVTTLVKNHLLVSTTDYENEEDDIKLICDYKDMEKAVKEQCHLVPELMDLLTEYVKAELDTDITVHRKWYLEEVLECCQGWQQTDIEVEDYNIVK